MVKIYPCSGLKWLIFNDKLIEMNETRFIDDMECLYLRYYISINIFIIISKGSIAQKDLFFNFIPETPYGDTYKSIKNIKGFQDHLLDLGPEK
jgi:hypothetical protein